MSRAAVVDVTVDDDLNIFTLALLGGRPHVMSCSLLTHGKRKVVNFFLNIFAASKFIVNFFTPIQ